MQDTGGQKFLKIKHAYKRSIGHNAHFTGIAVINTYFLI